MQDIMDKWLDRELESRKDSFNPEVINDMIDAFMASNQDGPLQKEYFARMLVDLFIGAIDTTSTVIGWMLFYLAHMPDEQDRLYHEICKVIPANSLPTLDHKAKLPRVEALINEIHRYGNMTMIGLPRCSFTNEIELNVDGNKYSVPKGGTIWFTNYISQHDKRYWLDPDNFRIDRWLDGETGNLINHSHWFQFGIGKRSCVGEQIGKNLLFLYVTAILHRYKWKQTTNFDFDSHEMRITKIPPSTHLMEFENRM